MRVRQNDPLNYGKDLPEVPPNMRPFALEAWAAVDGDCPAVFRRYQIGIRTLSVFHGHRIARVQEGMDSHSI